AQTVISTIKAERLVDRSAEMGQMWMSKLRSIPDGMGLIDEVRGKGLMIGIEMGDEAKKLQKVAFGERILVNVCAGSVVRLVPPLIVGESSVDRFNAVLRSFVIASS
ncbi:MAG: aminotransferase class III-fold pyridoxal phosphate-dependent enzyme, partial [Methanomassiliicoccales archaeon]|nr:aminotransferase class III-fold pyridoxal phosphate-dependent enzyme [Methanomassiliicoccales archaeon]